MQKFLSSFIAGGLTAATIGFSLYTAFKEDTNIVDEKVKSMRSILEPQLRFHLLKNVSASTASTLIVDIHDDTCKSAFLQFLT